MAKSEHSFHSHAHPAILFYIYICNDDGLNTSGQRLISRLRMENVGILECIDSVHTVIYAFHRNHFHHNTE